MISIQDRRQKLLLGNYYYPQGAPAVPVMEVYGNAVSIANGDATPSGADHTDFGTASAGGTVTRIFTIENIGTADLEDLVVTAPTGYTVTVQPSSTVAPGADTTFSVRFNTNVVGTYAGDISIASNIGAYTFAVTVLAAHLVTFDSTVTRTPSDGLYMSIKDVSFSALGDWHAGFFGGGGAISAANIEHGFKATSGGWLIIENGAALTPVFRTIATGVNYDLAIVYDANLFAHYWIRAGTEDWRRVWISTYAATDPTVFAEEFNDTATRTLSTERFGYLGTGLLVPSVNHAGSVPAATTGNAPDGDMLWRYVATTLPSAGSILLNVRRQDASNYWQNEIVGSNGNHLLDEVVAASSTNRISAAAAVTNGEKITARLIGNQATLYSTNTQDGQYTSAINHLRQLGYDLNSLGTGGVINDLRGYKAYARDDAGLGSELVANSDFTSWSADNPVGWTVTEGGTGSITQVAGGCRILSATDLVDISQSILTSGKYYSYTLVVDSYVSGTAQMYTGNTVSNLINISAAGTYTGYFIAVGATAGIKRQLGVGCDMVIASLSYKEVTFVDDALGTLLEGVVA